MDTQQDLMSLVSTEKPVENQARQHSVLLEAEKRLVGLTSVLVFLLEP